MVQEQELSNLNEASVAALLGVSRRMVRKYVKTRGLPHFGNGRRRRFDWALVREWFLLYRLEIVDRGGRQRSTLRRKLRKCGTSNESVGS